MASENPPAPREAVEHQDQSIKVRKSQLFEEPKQTNGTVLKPFSAYVNATPAAPIAPGLKAALWVVAVLVALLFLAALLFGRSSRPPQGRRADRTPDRPAVAAARGQTS